ncbi:MAG: bifunctional diaminohydroxyphosphoribosylaminopyrimidine deaminase/5-amino-6-(5-phosphoribosylamino)uracil reductase RibD [Dehalococcoidia bacterium]
MPPRTTDAAAEDAAHMRAALVLARRALGTAMPNPAVGCVIVTEGRVVGRGWTQPGGRPHAEAEALRRAGSLAKGGTAYVTLEPCSHHGRTPPCAEALIGAGIARAVVAHEDPDPRVAGEGVRALREGGIVVEFGLMEAEAREVNAGYLMRQEAGRPLVTLKTATTLDARIAMGSGESQWITGEAARRRAHLLRARHDAVMVGSGTVVSDDPLLTCRVAGLYDWSPIRVVVDSRLRIPLTAKVVATAGKARVIVITLPDADPARRQALEGAGVEVIEVGRAGDEIPNLPRALEELAERGVTRLLVEGGYRLATAMLGERLVDRIVWFRAPWLIGEEGLPFAGPLGLETLAQTLRFERIEAVAVGDDLWETYRRVA